MFGTMGDPPKRAGTLMPPATTRRLPDRPAASTREARIAPPYIPSGPQPPSAFEAESRVEPDSIADIAPEPEPLLSAAHEEQVPEPVEAAFEPETDHDFSPELDGWEDDQDNEGTVEPAFAADTDAVLNELSQHALETERKEEFPLDAFIVPEQTQHVPTGLEGTAATPPPEHTPASALAERLEKLSHRLRVEESDSVVRRLAGGDRLDALLAGLLAGYLAGKSEQQ